jgi:hypothetical protein
MPRNTYETAMLPSPLTPLRIKCSTMGLIITKWSEPSGRIGVKVAATKPDSRLCMSFLLLGQL